MKNVITAIHFKPTIDRIIQIEQHHTVEKNNSDRLKHEWEDKVRLSHKYASCLEEMLTMIRDI